MKKGKTVASPKLTEELLQNPDLVEEYVEYLKLKVKKNADGKYYCGTTEEKYKCWDKTERFCKQKGLDFYMVVDAFNLEFGCESNIARCFDLDAFRKAIEEGRKEVTIPEQIQEAIEINSSEDSKLNPINDKQPTNEL